jgi:hypothetical protein
VNEWIGDAEFSSMRFIQGDYSKWLFIARYSKIGYLPVSTAIKRELRESMSHPDTPQKKFDYYMSLYEIKKTYMARFPCSKQMEEKVESIFHKQKIRLAYAAKNFPSAKESYFFLRRTGQVTLKDIFYFFGCFIKSIKV